MEFQDKGRARAWALVGGLVLAVTALHYLTPPCHHWVHELARRLYYLPIVAAAFLAGWRGGLGVSLGVSLLYLPHAFLVGHTHHPDPGDTLTKALEIVLYVVVGLLTGFLVDRERRERRRQEALARQLRATLEDLRATEAQLVRSGRLGALGALTAGLAHEIRNPLHALRGTAEIVRDALDATHPSRRMQALHLEELDRLDRILERFLSFARPVTPCFTEVDLGEVARRVSDLAAAQARRDGVTLALRLDTPPPRVRGDAEQLAQVALGIVLNAMQFLESWEGPRRIEISSVLQVAGSRALAGLRFTNSGPSIPTEALERIFDPFFTTREGGTGLGLSIAARIVDAHGGLLEAANLDGGGVAFLLLLPVGPRLVPAREQATETWLHGRDAGR